MRLCGGVIPAETEASGKGCGVPEARLQGKSWPPPRLTVHGERGNRTEAAVVAESDP